MTRDAELKARDFVALVAGRRARRDRGRRRAAAAAAGADRAELLRRPGLGTRDGLARRSPTGCWSWPAAPSRAPTTSWRTSTRCATSVLSDRHTEVLAALLDADPATPGLAGLEVDTDLRWRIVTALAAAGEIDADGPQTPFIDAEAAAGPDRGGQAACRAGVGGTAAGRGQGGGVAAGDRGRHVGQHHRAVDHRRLRPARSARAAAAVQRQVLRRDLAACGSGDRARSRRRW